MGDYVWMLFIVEIKFLNCLAGLMIVDCAVRWNRVNRRINILALAGGNLWNRHQLECSCNQSGPRIRPTCCINCSTQQFLWKLTFKSKGFYSMTKGRRRSVK
jgi:hypothetical protein